jgi:hypothetical protein
LGQKTELLLTNFEERLLDKRKLLRLQRRETWLLEEWQIQAQV